MNIRDYQREDTKRIINALGDCNRVLYVLPTGGGKTVIAVQVIRKFIAKKKRVLFLAHRRELIDQAASRLIEAGIDDDAIGVILSQDKRIRPHARIQVASVQTLSRRRFPPADLVVVDEAHRAVANGYTTILKCYPTSCILGLTATPFREDDRGLGDAFNDLILGPSAMDLAQQGFLALPRIWTVGAEHLPNVKGVGKSRNDYAIGELSEATNRRELVGSATDHWKRRAIGKPTVAFCVDVAHAQSVAAAFVAEGIMAEVIHCETPIPERADILARLRSGETKVVANCEVLTEGWDFDALGCVILMRPTMSLRLYLQMVGRAMRPGNDPIVLDHAGNAIMHGAPQDHRDYSLDAPKRKAGGVPPMKACPNCLEVIAANLQFCPGCGHKFWDVAPPIEVTGELVELKRAELPFCAREGCGNRVKARSMSPHAIRKRDGRPPFCSIRCASLANLEKISPEHRAAGVRKRESSLTPEQRSERAAQLRNGYAAITPEKRAEMIRKREAAMTPEQRSERAEKARKTLAALTPEQRSERIRKAHASRDPEQRSESARRREAAKSPEVRSEIARNRIAAVRARKASAPEVAE